MSIYSRYDITTLPNGMAHLRMDTNDDNDDGYAEDVTIWEKDMKMSTALSIAGQKSHLGMYGQPVDVYLDGVKI